MKKEKYNIAVIGTGFMARKHCQNLVVLPSASLHTICSTKESEDKAYSFKDEFGFSNTSLLLTPCCFCSSLYVL